LVKLYGKVHKGRSNDKDGTFIDLKFMDVLGLVGLQEYQGRKTTYRSLVG
jgi:hypothetical protein